MRRTTFLTCSLVLAITVALAAPSFAGRFGMPAPPRTLAGVPRSGLGVSAWKNCGFALTPATTHQLAFQNIVVDGSGGAIVGWSDLRNNANFDDFATRLDPDGNRVSGWAAGGNAVSVSDSSEIVVAAARDNAAGAFFLYASVDPQGASGHDLTLQHVTSAGAVAASYPANGKKLIAGSVGTGFILPDGSGNLFFGWSAPDGSNVKFKLIDATGATAGGYPAGGIDTGVPDAANGGPALDGAGGLYGVWSDGSNVRVKRENAGGLVAGWTAAGLVVATPGADVDPRIVRLSNNDAMVTWVDPTTNHVMAMRVNANGTLGAGWPAGGLTLSSGTDNEEQPTIIADQAGGALVMWYEGVPPIFLFGNLFVQRVTAAGAIASGWPATGVKLENTDGVYVGDDIVSDNANGAIVAWTDLRNGTDANIFVHHVLAAGTVDGTWTADGVLVCDASGDQAFPRMVTDNAGGAILSWQDYTDSNNPQLESGRVLASGVVSALASLVDAAVEPGVVKLHWYTPDGSVPSATVERAAGDDDFVAVGEVLADGAGHLRFEDHDVTAGSVYHYRLAVLDGGTVVYLGQVTIRVPATLAFGLDGFRPNPTDGDVNIVFTLATSEAARLELIDVAGRRVLAREVGALGPGEHTLRLDRTAGLPAGIYVVRLTQGARQAVTRASLVR